MPLPIPLRVVILMPVRDDWASAAELIRRLDPVLASEPCSIDVLIVDDGSLQPCDPADFQADFAVIRKIRILCLRRNLGHQRAIAIGLVHVRQAMNCDAVMVMDADGEDTPEGALQLLRAYSGSGAVFAERTRRTESLVFQFFYQLYRMLHLLLTGISVRVGNFSILPFSYLDTLVVMSEMWNHYAAALFRSGLRYSTTPIPRGHRIFGTSRMNFVSLTAHGISAISVFGDVVGVRLLILSVAAVVSLGAAIFAFAARSASSGAVLSASWAAAIGVFIVICIQIITMAVNFTFSMLSNRINLTFIPLRDAELFVAFARDLNCDE